MECLQTDGGVVLSWRTEGQGPPLLLVHGSLSDHDSNWARVWPALVRDFTVHSLARRGRGATSATAGHGIAEEAKDVIALLAEIGEPAFLLGHSYGAHCALGAALRAPERVRKLILYEPPDPAILSQAAMAVLESHAARGDFDSMCQHFFAEVLRVPKPELDAYRELPEWDTVLADAPASLHDLRAVARHSVPVEALSGLSVETLVQSGTESPPDLFLTRLLMDRLPLARIGLLEGQAHEGMTTAPEAYAAQLRSFLLS